MKRLVLFVAILGLPLAAAAQTPPAPAGTAAPCAGAGARRGAPPPTVPTARARDR